MQVHFPAIEPVADQEKVEILCSAVIKAIDHWKLDSFEAAAVAGHDKDNWESLRAGRRPALLTREQVTRASLIIGIFNDLRTQFSDPLRYSWLTNYNKSSIFQGRRPVDVMLNEGIPGMVSVRRYIEGVGGPLSGLPTSESVSEMPRNR